MVRGQVKFTSRKKLQSYSLSGIRGHRQHIYQYAISISFAIPYFAIHTLVPNAAIELHAKCSSFSKHRFVAPTPTPHPVQGERLILRWHKAGENKGCQRRREGNRPLSLSLSLLFLVAMTTCFHIASPLVHTNSVIHTHGREQVCSIIYVPTRTYWRSLWPHLQAHGQTHTSLTCKYKQIFSHPYFTSS